MTAHDCDHENVVPLEGALVDGETRCPGHGGRCPVGRAMALYQHEASR